MSSLRKETDAEKAFREASEHVESVLATMHSACLPEGTDYHYYKTLPQFHEACSRLAVRIKELMVRLPGSSSEELQALEKPEEAYDWSMKLMDRMLEQVDSSVDKGNQLLERQTMHGLSATQRQAAMPAAMPEGDPRQASREAKKTQWLEAQQPGMKRPQDAFKWDIDNSNTTFKGLLSHWHEFVSMGQGAPARLVPIIDQVRLDFPEEASPHPLLDVLDHMEYPSEMLQAREPIKYRGLDATPLTYVDTEEELRGMADKLTGATEIAVDLEHHSFRTFQGITCLMQLSDRREDYIIDVIKLRHSVGPVLAPIFADPKVVKVMHGADWDVIWLQRDFGIYIANLFDTGQATRVLQHPRFGLGHMLERLCGVKTDKRYQLADWRIRPLQKEMLLYARMDTHYLLYMYDLLQTELIRAGDRVPEHLGVPIPKNKPGAALGTVLERSRGICAKRYLKPLFSPDGYLELLDTARDRPLLSRRQEAVLAALYKWRDEVARERDDSLEFVMPKRQLFNISKLIPLTTRALKQAVKGDSAPSMVLAVADEIVGVVSGALDDATPASPGIDPGEAAEMMSELPGATDTTPDPATQQQAASTRPGPQLHTGLRPAAAQASVSPIGGPQVATSEAGHPGDLQTQQQGQPHTKGTQLLQPGPSAVQPQDRTLDTGSALLHQPQSYPLPQGDELATGDRAHAQQAVSTATAGRCVEPPADPLGNADSTAATSSPGEAAEQAVDAARPILTVVAVKPLKVAKSSAMRAMLGRKPAKPIADLVPGALLPGPEENSQKSMATRVLASMTVAYPKMPESMTEVSSAAHKVNISGEALKDTELTPTPAHEIRDVADAMQADLNTACSPENAHPGTASPIAAAAKRERVPEPLGDYLPLPISQKIPPRGTHKLQPLDVQDSQGRHRHHGGMGQATADAIMREAGLASDSSSDAEEEGSEASTGVSEGSSGSQEMGQETAETKRAAKKPRLGLTDESGFLSGSMHAAASLPSTERSENMEIKSSKQHKAATGRGPPRPAEIGLDFDYAAARAAAPGLSLALDEAPARGGRGRRGRGGRTAGRIPPQAQPDGFSLYTLDESKFMKGGKRSAVMPRSGNRNLTFR